MKKISIMGHFNDPQFEGLTTLVINMKKELHKRGFEILINDFNADILHFNSGGFLLATKLGNFKNKKTIYSLYSNINTGFFSFARNCLAQLKYSMSPALFKRLLIVSLSCLIPLCVKRHFLKKASVVTVPSDYLKNVLKLNNCKVIRFGVNIDKFRNLNFENKKLTLGYFGHFSPFKGFGDVLEAYKKVGDFNKNIHLTFYKQYHDEKKTINKFKKIYYKYNVSFYGYAKDIAKQYNRTDIVILPYRTLNSSIGNPLTLLEAMACERAIITTNLPHIKEIVGDSAILVDPYSPDQIVKAINKLKNDPKLRQELGKKTRERVVKYYTDKKMLNTYVRLYGDLK